RLDRGRDHAVGDAHHNGRGNELLARGMGDRNLCDYEFGRNRSAAGHGADRFRIGRSQDAAFGDDGGDIFGGRHVEGGILDGDAVGRDLNSVDVRDLAGAALLDWDEVAGSGRGVDGVEGRGDVERDSVFFGEDAD